MSIARDLLLAHRARRYGAKNSLRIVWEARRAGIPISLGFAICEKESNFANVFGHDPTSSIPAVWKGEPVTKDRYLRYKKSRSSGGCQGVGPTQITSATYQDRADELGGAWIPKNSIRAGFEAMASHTKGAGAVPHALATYNGSGPVADAYGRDLHARMEKWHNHLKL
jgi:hypothetical protein